MKILLQRKMTINLKLQLDIPQINGLSWYLKEKHTNFVVYYQIFSKMIFQLSMSHVAVLEMKLLLIVQKENKM